MIWEWSLSPRAFRKPTILPKTPACEAMNFKSFMDFKQYMSQHSSQAPVFSMGNNMRAGIDSEIGLWYQVLYEPCHPWPSSSWEP